MGLRQGTYAQVLVSVGAGFAGGVAAGGALEMGSEVARRARCCPLEGLHCGCESQWLQTLVSQGVGV